MPRLRKSLSTLGVLAKALISQRGWVTLNQYAEPLATSLKSGAVPFFSWSQDGEDAVLIDLIQDIGFYVDVGAHHPTRFSITKSLYEAGWHGVNIDAAPGFTLLFAEERPRDINVESLVGTPGVRPFFRFTDPAYSTLDPDRAEELQTRGIELLDVEDLEVRSLSSILHQHLMPRALDLLSIDVEGVDIEVLISHDFEAFPPSWVLIEVPLNLDEINQTDIHGFLVRQGYRANIVLKRSVLYKRLPTH